MVDRLTKEHRSWNMSRIRSRDTKPELRVRSLVHRLGYRFRLQAKGLVGRPDLVLPRYHTAVFVHGCYWHRHPGCPNATHPRSRVEFWQAKFARNVERDAEVREALEADGWRVVVIWECETTPAEQLRDILIDRLPPRVPATAEQVFRPGWPGMAPAVPVVETSRIG